MDIISRWVAQIIVFLLLAIIIDLLVPATAMKRYIKLVIGLILMLIFLKPIFFLFTIDFESELSSSLDTLYRGEMSEEIIENLTKVQKVDIETTQAAYILEEMTFQLKDLAEEPLLNNYHVEITHIEFLFSAEQVINFEGLEELIVYLREVSGREGMVRKIEEVNIQTGEIEEHVETEKDEEIKKTLQEIWEISNKDLTIKWEGGVS